VGAGRGRGKLASLAFSEETQNFRKEENMAYINNKIKKYLKE
jgi:hypothetical protein